MADPKFREAAKNRDLAGAGDAALDHLPLVGDGRGFKQNLKEGNYVMAGLNAVGAVAEGIPFVKRWFGSGAKTVKQAQGVKQLEKQVAKEVAGEGAQKAARGVRKIGANTKKMTDQQIGKMFGDKNWHKKSDKKKLIQQYKKELKGSENADFLVDKKTGEVFLEGNKSGAIVKTDLISE